MSTMNTKSEETFNNISTIVPGSTAGSTDVPGTTTIGSTSLPRSRTMAVAGSHEVALSRLILAISMVAGSFLRIWQINAMGFNTDEAVYAGQAAAIAGVPGLKDIFPIFRAHPLLFQFVLSLIYKVQFSDLAGRLLAVGIGLGTIYLTYLTGKMLYGRLPGAAGCIVPGADAISRDRFPAVPAGWTDGVLCHPDLVSAGAFWKNTAGGMVLCRREPPWA